VNLAVALAKAGHSVGLLDADVYGFSVPKMLGTDHDPIILGDVVIPTQKHGVKCLSMGYFVPDDQPVIWRGPMLHKAIEQFLSDAYWASRTSCWSTCLRARATWLSPWRRSCPRPRSSW